MGIQYWCLGLGTGYSGRNRKYKHTSSLALLVLGTHIPAIPLISLFHLHLISREILFPRSGEMRVERKRSDSCNVREVLLHSVELQMAVMYPLYLGCKRVKGGWKKAITSGFPIYRRKEVQSESSRVMIGLYLSLSLVLVSCNH